jgi:hypothetical protein
MIVKIHAGLLFTIGAMLAVCTGSLNGQTPPQTYSYHKIVLEPESWNWTKETWDKNNGPYHKVRVIVDSAVASPKSLSALLSQYKAEAQKKSGDPIAVYRWGYAAYKTTTKQDSISAHKTLEGLQQTFQNTPSPHTYDYARLRFLVGEFYTAHRQTAAVGERLLASDKKDYIVAYRLASIYLDAYYPARVQEALSICNAMKQQYPARASIYALAGEAYLITWHRNHAPADAQSVVENYQKYLNLAPPKDDFRKRAQQIVNEYEKKS